MKKPLFSALYFLTLVTAGLTIGQSFAQQRNPSIEPMTEVSIESDNAATVESKSDQGFNFADKPVTRAPANIVSKIPDANSTPYTFIGPLIFLIALPIGLWIVISKKLKNNEVAEKVEYYPKTFQFKPHKTAYQKEDTEDEDQQFPKAS